MTEVRVSTQINVQGENAGDAVRVYHHNRSAWLEIHCGETGPQVVVFFADGLKGRNQVLALIDQLEQVAAIRIAEVEQSA